MNENGSTTVEFTIAFIVASLALPLIVRLLFSSISSELVSYSAYMKSRTFKAYGYSAGVRAADYVRKECEDSGLKYAEEIQPCYE